MFPNKSYTGPIIEALELRFDGKINLSIRMLEKYIKQHPDDEGALYELASTLFTQQRGEEALQIVRKLLQSNPQHLPALRLASDLLIDLNEPEEAQRKINFAIEVYDALSTKYKEVDNGERLRESLRRVQWRALRANGRFTEALEIARQLAQQSKRGLRDLQTSLIDTDNLVEAESTMGESTEGRLAAIWAIGIQLGEQKKYEIAKLYFLRSLSYSSLPKEFNRLSAYIECLALADQTEAAQHLNAYWLTDRRVKSVHSVRRLQIMSAVIDSLSGDQPAAKNQMQSLCKEWGKKNFKRYAIYGTTFDDFRHATEEVI